MNVILDKIYNISIIDGTENVEVDHDTNFLTQIFLVT